MFILKIILINSCIRIVMRQVMRIMEGLRCVFPLEGVPEETQPCPLSHNHAVGHRPDLTDADSVIQRYQLVYYQHSWAFLFLRVVRQSNVLLCQF